MKTITEQLKKQLRASWRRMLVSLARLKARVQEKLEPRTTDRTSK